MSLASRLRSRLDSLRAPREENPRAEAAVGVPVAGGYVDTLRLQDGVVSASGWSPDLSAFERALTLQLDDEPARTPTHAFRVPRPDVKHGMTQAGFSGGVVEWMLEPSTSPRKAHLLVNGRRVRSLHLPPLPGIPFGHLHTCPQVLGREQIYGSGPPVHVVSEEVLSLARTLKPPVLDFGCGGGALVRALRRDGIEAYGLELDDERIRQHLLDEARPWVTLYDGSMPSPFPDRRFASIVSSEVLEHIPAPEHALAEMARLGTTRLMVTVPDMSSIPRGFPYGVVPWHLLESTHVNFFTQHSLVEALRPFASDIEVSRIGLREWGDLRFYTSLAAIARLDMS